MTPAKRLIMMGNRPKNEVQYNPATWAEWTSNGEATKDVSGIEITAVNGTGIYVQIGTTLKGSTKYGLLYEVVSNNLGSYIYGSSALTGTAFAAGSSIGYNKVVLTTQEVISTNVLKISTSDGCTTGTKIKFKGFRVFELPTGSQIEWDFTNLTPDQLNIKYPF